MRLKTQTVWFEHGRSSCGLRLSLSLISSRLTASDIMETNLTYVYPHTRVQSLVSILRTTVYHAFPVVTENRQNERDFMKGNILISNNIHFKVCPALLQSSSSSFPSKWRWLRLPPPGAAVTLKHFFSDTVAPPAMSFRLLLLFSLFFLIPHCSSHNIVLIQTRHRFNKEHADFYSSQ